MVERRRSALRTAVVWEALQGVVATGDGRSLRVVDLGGGTGGIAVRIAELNHDVTVIDPSPDALASLERRAVEAGVSSSVHGVLGDADTLPDLVEAGSADVLICHGVLELVDDPATTLAAVARALAPGGQLSVLAFQRSAAIAARALGGHPSEARALVGTTASEASPRYFSQDELSAIVAEAGLTRELLHGVRVFADHIHSSVVESDPHAYDELLALERDAAGDPDLTYLATQLHLLARR